MPKMHVTHFIDLKPGGLMVDMVDAEGNRCWFSTESLRNSVLAWCAHEVERDGSRSHEEIAESIRSKIWG